MTDLNVQLGWLATVENAGEFVAASKGFYAEEGLNPTLTPGGRGRSSSRPSCPARRSSASRRPTRSPSPTPRAPDSRSSASTLQQNPSAVMSLASNPVPDAKSLEGKRLGLQQTGDAIYQAFFVKAASMRRR